MQFLKACHNKPQWLSIHTGESIIIFPEYRPWDFQQLNTKAIELNWVSKKYDFFPS